MDYQYSWKLTGSTSWSSMSNIPYKTFYKIPISEGPKFFQVRVYPEGCSTYADELTGNYIGIGMGTDEGGGASRPSKVEWPGSPTLTPNPTTSNWDLTLSNDWKDKTVNIQVIATDGSVVSDFTKPANSTITIDATQLAAGIYIIHVKSGAMSTSVKAVKQ